MAAILSRPHCDNIGDWQHQPRAHVVFWCIKSNDVVISICQLNKVDSLNYGAFRHICNTIFAIDFLPCDIWLSVIWYQMQVDIQTF